MLKPNDVFTPARLPLKDANIYASRGEAESELETALRRSMIPVVFGEYAVGKTSLVLHHLLDAERQGRVIYIESVADMDFGEVVLRCLQKLNYSVTRSATDTIASGGSAGAGGEISLGFEPLKATLNLSGKADGSRETSTTREFVVSSPSSATLVSVCEARRAILVLDEMHKASTRFVQQLGVFLKTYANSSCDEFRVVIVGTAPDASRLVDLEPGIDRLVQEVHLRQMTRLEARYLIKTGMRKLGIKLPAKVLERIIQSSVGSPAIVQYLSLEVAESSFQRKPRAATERDFERAKKLYLERRSKRLNEAYLKAIETSGPKRYRKLILHALSDVEDEFATMDQIRSKVSETLKEEVPSSVLSGPLRDLKDERFGPVLKDIQRHEGGERVHNYTAFVDPAMKSFIRFLRAE